MIEIAKEYWRLGRLPIAFSVGLLVGYNLILIVGGF